MSGITEKIEWAAADAKNHQGRPDKIRGQRRAGAGTPAVLSVRLTAEQLAELAARAEAAGQPTSAYARSILLDALGAGDRDEIAAKLEAVLRHTLAPRCWHTTRRRTKGVNVEGDPASVLSQALQG